MSSIKWAFKKLLLTLGGIVPAIVITAACSLVFLAVDQILGSMANTQYFLGIVNLDEGTYGDELILEIGRVDAVKAVILPDSDVAEESMKLGRVEAWVTIPENYTEQVRAMKKVDFDLHSAPDSISEQMGRGVLAQLNMEFISKEETYNRCKDLFSTYDECKAEVDAKLCELDAKIAKQYSISFYGEKQDKTSKGLFMNAFAKRSGLVAFVILLVLTSMLPYLCSSDVLRTSRRLLSTRRATLYGYISDYFTLLFAAVIVIAIAKIFMTGLSILDCFRLVPYAVCTSGLCLMYVRYAPINGSIDMLAPSIVLITSFLGGCFFDIASISAPFAVLSCLTPQGLFLYGLSTDKILPSIALLAIGLITFLIGLNKYKRG